MLQKIVFSRITKLFLSLVLIYLAFRKVNIQSLVLEISTVPWWFILAMMVYFFISMFINSTRWSLLVIDKPRINDFFEFTKATYLGAFYGLFLPSTVGGDLMKWLPLLKKYPNLSKTKLLGSILLDRVIGFSAFVIMGLVSLLLGKYFGYVFPDMLMWLFSLLALGIISFYILVFTFDFEKIFSKYHFLTSFLEIVTLLRHENKKRIFICFMISIFVEPIWVLPFWFYSLLFSVGLNFIQVFIFVPVIALILVLPISIAGFGARENLFLFFLKPLGFVDEKILLMSTVAGIFIILTNLCGSLFLLLPDKIKEKK